MTSEEMLAKMLPKGKSINRKMVREEKNRRGSLESRSKLTGLVLGRR